MLLREGLTRLLTEAGVEVLAQAQNGDALVDAVRTHQPDVAIVDIRMPPTYTNEGAVAATHLRAEFPRLGILLLSQSIETKFALDLARSSPQRLGYLLKDRVIDVATLIEAVTRVAAGGTVLDPDVVAHFLGKQAAHDRLSELTEREREVLGLMAEGRSNQAIARAMVVNERTVETYVAAIFSKLQLVPAPDDHRRVLAVLAWVDR